MIQVLLNVSSPALRAGLRALLSSDGTIKILNDSLEEDTEADVVITSASRTSFPSNGLDPASSVATLFLSDDQLNLNDMRRSSRVWGILPTDASAEELIAAIHALSQGLIVGSSTLLFESESEPLSHGPLTDREVRSLGFACKRVGE